MSGTTRRALLIGGGLAAAGVVGFVGWRSAEEHARDVRLAEGQALLEAGQLRDARVIAEALMAEHSEFLGGYLLAARTLRALHDRGATEDVLAAAYALSPRGFPMLSEYVDHRMRGPDDPKKGYDNLAFLDQHLARFPEDENLVAQGRLVALAFLLGQRGKLSGQQLGEVEQLADASLAAFRIDGAGTTIEHYDRAQVLLALGHVEASIAAGRAGITANTDTWTSLVMHWAIVTSLLHHGKEDEAWRELAALRATLDGWTGTHFGMGKPLVEFIQLTTAVRQGSPTAAPPDYAARLARLDAEGVRLQYGDAETRQLVGALLAALARNDAPAALSAVADLLGIVARDRGCEMENQLIRPHIACLLYVARGNVMYAQGALPDAETAYRAAQALFPEDTWIDMKVGLSTYAAVSP